MAPVGLVVSFCHFYNFYNFVIATTEFSDIHYTTLHIAIKPRANMAKHISLTHGI